MAKASDNEFPSVLFGEQVAAPTTPGTGDWRLFFKSDGLYHVDDAGAVTGPISAGGGAASSPGLTEADTITVSRGASSAVAATSYHTLLDVTTGGAEVVGGAVYGANCGLRITIDGTVILNETTNAGGASNGGDVFTVANIPHLVADTSLKIELYNISGTSKNYGWRIYSI